MIASNCTDLIDLCFMRRILQQNLSSGARFHDFLAQKKGAVWDSFSHFNVFKIYSRRQAQMCC